MSCRAFSAVVLAGVLLSHEADAGLLGRLLNRGDSQSEEGDDSEGNGRRSRGREIKNLPENVTAHKDIAYGDDNDQKMDVYIPSGAKNAPVMFMVHGGGWKRGDKGGQHVAGVRIERWGPKGFIFISTNYRMVPEADPLVQSEDVMRAIAFAQKHAAEWGGDPRKFVLMGHSAGAHLVAMVTSQRDKAAQFGVQPWLGSIFMDSGALDVTEIMEKRHFGLYDNAFGDDPAFWKSVSPTQLLAAKTYPVLSICSKKHKSSCKQSHDYADKATAFGGRAEVMESSLGHGKVMGELGKDNDYTLEVEQWLATLDPLVAKMLFP